MEAAKRKNFGSVVPARSATDIEAIANRFRGLLGLTNRSYFPVDKVFDLIGEVFDGADYQVLQKNVMGDHHGITYPDRKLIHIREDIFDGACNGSGFERFTLCHELGHLIMHQKVLMHRTDAPLPIYHSAEWQSDTFASALLMPRHLLTGSETVQELCLTFGVSSSAASVRLRKLKDGR